MKKLFLISILMFLVIGMNAQGSNKDQKSEPKDSITASDIAKTKYLVSIIVMQYSVECFNDSVPITEFYDKPIGGVYWKTKGQYYWNIYDPLPQNVKYLHRKMSAEGLLEVISTKLGK